MRYGWDTIIATFYILTIGMVMVVCWVRLSVSHVLNSLVVALLIVVASRAFSVLNRSEDISVLVIFVSTYMLAFTVGLPIRLIISFRRRGSQNPGCCQDCGYDLRGLTLPRCPECGLFFDIENGGTTTAVAGPLDRSQQSSISIVYVLASILSLVNSGLLYATIVFAGVDKVTDASGLYLWTGFGISVLVALLCRTVVAGGPIGRLTLWLATMTAGVMATLWWSRYA